MWVFSAIANPLRLTSTGPDLSLCVLRSLMCLYGYFHAGKEAACDEERPV